MNPDPIPPTMAAALDPDEFRRLAGEVATILARHLEAAHAREPGLPVLPPVAPDRLLAEWPSGFPATAGGRVTDWLERVLAASNHLHHPRYVGHQVTAPLPMAAVCNLAVSLLNNAMAVYEMGPAATVMERRLIEWMSHLAGWPVGADGVFTHGGSVGNLTALLAARQVGAGFDVWKEGSHAGQPLALLASDQAHYCVRRAMQIMGGGEASVIPVASDERFRLRPEALPAALQKAREEGRRVIGVAASAASTATGAFDPLEPIAEFCAREGLWLHVDGAHGASFLLSDRLRPLLRGLERADSLVWDAHKMMLMPALTTAVLFREGRHSHAAFAQQASYLYVDEGDEPPWYDVGLRTLECTKQMIGFPLYAALQVLGTEFFARYVESRVDLAARFAARLREAPDFDLPVEPEANIVCFRHRPPEGVDGNAWQTAIRRGLLAEGSFYLVQTSLRGQIHLRTTIIHPMTTEDDLLALLDTIRGLARRLSATG